MQFPWMIAQRCVIAATIAQILAASFRADERTQLRARYASAEREYQVTKGYYDELRVTPTRYFAALQKVMAARLGLCVTKDEQIAVIKEYLAIASREIEREENDLEGSRPYDRDPELRYAKSFLIECGARLNRLTGAP